MNKDYRKEYYQKNRASILKWQKKYAQDNKEKLRKYRHEHYYKNIESISKRSKEWYIKNKEKVKIYRLKNKLKIKRWYIKNREEILKKSRIRDENIRKLVFNHYGNKCIWCGQSNPIFLTIDHINGGGGKHRKKIHRCAGINFYRWLKLNNFPEGFQLLCFNCNCAKLRGYNPLKDKKEKK
jgi:hypothetical protein